MQLTAVQDTPAKRAAVGEWSALDPRNGEANERRAIIVETRAWSGRGHRKRRKDGIFRREIWTKLPSMTSWAEGLFRASASTALRAAFGDSGLVRWETTTPTKSDATRKVTPCLGQGNLGSRIWTPCDPPRHNCQRWL